jgi:mannose-6-phosphate isomerase-like protein (cupin superfamily)
MRIPGDEAKSPGKGIARLETCCLPDWRMRMERFPGVPTFFSKGRCDMEQPRQAQAPATPRVIGPADGHFVDLGALGIRFLVWSGESGGNFSLVEHPIPPRTLAAPLHRHANEDEYSYVLEGRLGAVLGDAVVYATPGDLVFKPRNQWHTFWNAGDGPCRILEIISPGGFEQMFAEMGRDPKAFTGDAAPDLDAAYSLDVDYDSIERLCREHGLGFPE